ncbi:MAG TPA: hypothetical protein PK544_18480 [Spirochaetota bacterium]|nr:hypothetical protein [Spirochaetota bacterium]
MAQVDLNPAFLGMRGAVGSVVFFTRNGKTFTRKRVPQRNPKTPAQMIIRNSMKQAVAEWRAMDREEKEIWNRRGREVKRTGYHCYLGRRMKELQRRE